MKTYAGDIYIELPGTWSDDSSYVYRDPTSDVEVRIERNRPVPGATADSILGEMEQRLGLLGPLGNVKRDDATLAGRPARRLSLSCRREGDDEASLMDVMVVVLSEAQVVTITVTAPSTRQAAFAAAGRHLIATFKPVEVR